MKYISTRGKAPKLSFDEVLLTGLARDGGLYVPETWPTFSADEIRAMADMNYREIAVKVMTPFVEEVISADELAGLINDAYKVFDAADVVPMKDLGNDEYLLELFHGPTLAFKDVALQMLGQLFDHVLTKQGKTLTIAGATSGDTGSAAIEACRDRDAIEIFIMHPEGLVTEVQRRQMTTILSSNVHNIALQGNFDDCQSTVKALFNDEEFRDTVKLSAVNSINWARIMAQIVYYFWAGTRLGAPDKAAIYSVPTGNFGNVFAGYAAMQMGLPIEEFIIGSNANDILIRFIESGKMEQEDIVPTISPSMDIQISSNFERLLFELSGRDADKVSAMMETFAETGSYDVDKDLLDKMLDLFDGARLDDTQTKAVMKEVYETSNELIDTHTAIAVGAGRAKRRVKDVPLVFLATAHPAKFPDAVKAATGQHPELPPHLSDLLEREERTEVLANSVDTVRGYILDTLKDHNKL